MSDTAIKGIMDVTMDKIRTMVDADTIIGKEITLENGIVIIPVSKISFGFASGGSDFPSRVQQTRQSISSPPFLTRLPLCLKRTRTKKKKTLKK